MLSNVAVTHVFATGLQRTQRTVGSAGHRRRTGDHGDRRERQRRADAGTGRPRAGLGGVVAGHSNTVPQLAAAMGTPLSGLDERGYIPDAQYDRLVQVVRGREVQPSLVQLQFCAPGPASR